MFERFQPLPMHGRDVRPIVLVMDLDDRAKELGDAVLPMLGELIDRIRRQFLLQPGIEFERAFHRGEKRLDGVADAREDFGESVERFARVIGRRGAQRDDRDGGGLEMLREIEFDQRVDARERLEEVRLRRPRIIENRRARERADALVVLGRIGLGRLFEGSGVRHLGCAERRGCAIRQ